MSRSRTRDAARHGRTTVTTRQAVQGFVAPGFEQVRESFAATLATGEFGAAFAATHRGRPVVDLWGGRADSSQGRPWEADSVATIFSGTKGLVAACLLLLIGEGRLDLDRPVRDYWPEFGACGKDDILIRHAVSHTAGLPGVQADVPLDLIPSASQMAALLARQEPFWSAGSCLCYHPFTYGWLCGELTRRVTGATVGGFLQDRIAGPHGLEIWIGIPDSVQKRAARCELAPGWVSADPLDPPGDIEPWQVRRIWENPRLFEEPLPWNRASWRSAEIAGAGALATARGMAAFYGLLVGENAKRGAILTTDLITLGETELASGVDPCSGEVMRFGVGWELQTEERPFGPPGRAFGHPGAGGSCHGAWPELDVGFSFVPNLMVNDGTDRRSASLLEALHDCVS